MPQPTIEAHKLNLNVQPFIPNREFLPLLVSSLNFSAKKPQKRM